MFCVSLPKKVRAYTHESLLPGSVPKLKQKESCARENEENEKKQIVASTEEKLRHTCTLKLWPSFFTSRLKLKNEDGGVKKDGQTNVPGGRGVEALS